MPELHGLLSSADWVFENKVTVIMHGNLVLYFDITFSIVQTYITHCSYRHIHFFLNTVIFLCNTHTKKKKFKKNKKFIY